MKNGLNKINGAKLRELLKEKGKKNLSSISREMGYSDSFLGNAIIQNAINKVAIMWLNEHYGIKFEEYCETAEVKPEVKEAEKDNNEIIAKLDEILNAINKLGNIQMQELEYLREIKNKPNGGSIFMSNGGKPFVK